MSGLAWGCAGPGPPERGDGRVEPGVRVGRALILGPTIVDPISAERRRAEAIYIENGAILSIGAPPVPRDEVDLVIDATGRFVLPGLVDMHVHHSADGVFPTVDRPLYDESDLVLYLAHGVTTVRNMAGREEDPALADEIALGSTPRPRYFSSGPPVLTGGRDDAVETVAQARALVRAQQAAGFDLIKLYCCFGPERSPLFEALLDEARHLGIPVAGHVPKDLPLDRAHGMRTIEHLEHLAYMLDTESTESLADAGVFVTPTLAPFASHSLADPGRLETFLATTRARFISEVLWEPELEAIADGDSFLQNTQMQTQTAEMLEAAREAVTRLAEAGVPLLVGTDAGGLFPVVPGFSYPDELELLVDAGLEPAAVLKAATWNAARALGVEHRRGRVAVGMDADLVLLDADPLSQISNVRTIAGVMVNGWWLDRRALDAAVAAQARR